MRKQWTTKIVLTLILFVAFNLFVLDKGLFSKERDAKSDPSHYHSSSPVSKPLKTEKK